MRTLAAVSESKIHSLLTGGVLVPQRKARAGILKFKVTAKLLDRTRKGMMPQGEAVWKWSAAADLQKGKGDW